LESFGIWKKNPDTIPIENIYIAELRPDDDFSVPLIISYGIFSGYFVEYETRLTFIRYYSGNFLVIFYDIKSPIDTYIHYSGKGSSEDRSLLRKSIYTWFMSKYLSLVLIPEVDISIKYINPIRYFPSILTRNIYVRYFSISPGSNDPIGFRENIDITIIEDIKIYCYFSRMILLHF
jgi:hypothetical protein